MVHIKTDSVGFSELLEVLVNRVKGNGCRPYSFIDPRQAQQIANQVDDFAKEAKVVLPETKKPVDASRFHDTGVSLWAALYEAALRRIDPDVRGLSELKDYLDRFVRFEDLLYDAATRYRDHIIHSLWVLALGDWCYGKFGTCGLDMMYTPLICSETREGATDVVIGYPEAKAMTTACGALSGSIEPISGRGWVRGLSDLYGLRDAIWASGALLHDIGYPLEKIVDVDAQIRETLEYFGPFYPSALDYHWSPIQAQSLTRFCVLLSEVLHYPGSINELTGNTGTTGFHLEPEEYAASEASKSLEDREHGALSAYLLYRLTRTFKRLYVSRSIGRNDAWWFRTFLAKQTILNGIISHSNKVRRYDFLPQFSAFLFLVDELEDGNRIYKREGEKGYRVRPFGTEFGVARRKTGSEEREDQETLFIGVKVTDDFQPLSDKEARAEKPRKAFSSRFSKFFHFLNSNRVAATETPVVVRFEFNHTDTDSHYSSELQFHGLDVNIVLDIKEKNTNPKLEDRLSVEKFFQEQGVHLMQPWVLSSAWITDPFDTNP